MINFNQQGLGWQRDLPDFRDFTDDSADVNNILKKSKALKRAATEAPKGLLQGTVDLRAWCSPIEDQGSLGSCTANAAAGLVEYYQRRAFNTYLDASRLFIYKVSRNLLQWTGDTGAYLRTTMKALVLFGAPPERYWAYNIPDFELEPTAFCYSFAANYKAIKYFRLDPPGSKPAAVLNQLKVYLAAGMPSMFGFSVYSSIPAMGDGKGEIPFPVVGDTMIGGHAILAVGYDDNKQIGPDRGALLIRNSWGEHWGAAGYGWLPYRYVTAGIAVDFWSMTQEGFINTSLFE